MKKLIVIILTIVALITLSAVVYAKDLEFHDGVYRGEKWEFNFGQPKKNNITIIPQDRPEPKVYGNGYVGRVEISEKEYEIILLGQ
ncbi:MAG: hypothetical protein J6D52_04530 [Clostridia bacterium]|nr:hypothetical protein [Clostridia bacterium]